MGLCFFIGKYVGCYSDCSEGDFCEYNGIIPTGIITMVCVVFFKNLLMNKAEIIDILNFNKIKNQFHKHKESSNLLDALRD